MSAGGPGGPGAQGAQGLGRVQPILLAAGRASRFGGDKLIAPGRDGRALVDWALEPLRVLGHEILVVVADPSQGVVARLRDRPGVRLAICADAHLGLGRSVACAVQQSPAAAGWLIALADMPAVSQGVVAAVARALETGASIAAPICAGRRGHPVGFARAWRDPLLALDADRGAAALIATAPPSAVRLIPTEDAGILFDIDSPCDLASWTGLAPGSDGASGPHPGLERGQSW